MQFPSLEWEYFRAWKYPVYPLRSCGIVVQQRSSKELIVLALETALVQLILHFLHADQHFWQLWFNWVQFFHFFLPHYFREVSVVLEIRSPHSLFADRGLREFKFASPSSTFEEGDWIVPTSKRFAWLIAQSKLGSHWLDVLVPHSLRHRRGWTRSAVFSSCVF